MAGVAVDGLLPGWRDVFTMHGESGASAKHLSHHTQASGVAWPYEMINCWNLSLGEYYAHVSSDG